MLPPTFFAWVAFTNATSHHYLICYDHIARLANAMADDASRLWSLAGV
jgi:hypothetical protein